jgi:hypothetical protein
MIKQPKSITGTGTRQARHPDTFGSLQKTSAFLRGLKLSVNEIQM